MNTGSETLSSSPALEIHGLVHDFGGRRALDGLDLTLMAGEFKVLLGPNGAGKTTLFSLITRLYAAQAGEIRVFGKPLDREPVAALARMGVVFQEPALDLELTVARNLDYHAALHGLSRREAQSRGMAALERLDLAERIEERVRDLNGGHRRRVEIARALLHGPELLLLDEPTVGLDVPTRSKIIDYVHSLARDDGVAVLWATHLIDEVRDGDGIVVLHRGRKKADSVYSQLLRDTDASDLAGAFAALIEDEAGT